MDYSKIRGFNVHGDWGGTGVTEWLQFDAERYREMIAKGKENFPGMNTVRIWLSFEAYLENKTKYLAAVKAAADILTEAGLWIIPVYFNGWFGVPSFGGFVPDNVSENHCPAYIKCAHDTTLTLKDANILMFDLSNEPFNSVHGNQEQFEKVMRFLEKISQTVRALDSRPITVGTESGLYMDQPEMCDIDRIAPIVDVFSLHPYNMYGTTAEEHKKMMDSILDRIKKFNKPYLITECIWGAPTAEERKIYLETELEVYRQIGIGFLCHALFTCPVADLCPLDEIGCEKGLYMAFLDREFKIRPHHDLFNRYS